MPGCPYDYSLQYQRINDIADNQPTPIISPLVPYSAVFLLDQKLRQESRLVIFGGWANKWLDDVWQINVSSIVGPPYAITKVEPPLGPVTGQMKVTIYGVGFQSTNGMDTWLEGWMGELKDN